MARCPVQVLVLPYRRDPDGEIRIAIFRRADAGYWQAITGGVESGETLTDTARREAHEEAAIPPGRPWIKLATRNSIPADAFDRSAWAPEVLVVDEHCFAVQIDADDEIALSPEHVEYQWVTVDQARNLLKWDSNKTAAWELGSRLRDNRLAASYRESSCATSESALADKIAQAVEVVREAAAGDPAVKGVVWFGSAQAGKATASSDLDFYIVTEGPDYWRQWRHAEVLPVEQFVVPVHVLRQWFAQPDVVALRAFATGTIVFERDGTIRELMALASKLYQAGPASLNEAQIAVRRWSLTSLVRELDGCPPTLHEAQILASLVIERSLDVYCALNGIWADKPRHMLHLVSEKDPGIRAIVARHGITPQGARLVTDHVLAPVGGRLLNYESPHRV